MRQHRWILLTSVFAVGLAGGYLLVRTARVEPTPVAKSPETPAPVSYEMQPDAPARSADRKSGRDDVDIDALNQGAVIGQRTISFKDKAAMERFLQKMKGSGISILGRLDALNTLTVGFINPNELASLLDGSEEVDFVYSAFVPDVPEGSIQPGAVPLGDRLTEWLGIGDVDNSNWGAGVKIAILDTGISTLASFAGNVTHASLVNLPTDPSLLNGHGTAVAGLIHQIVPEADLLSYRIADDSGYSTSALIAQGILQAVTDGADIINISLGGFGDSKVLRDAVAYALERGVVIVSSPGNNGLPQMTQPASIPGVKPIGAVDANNDILAFSNSGENMWGTAPGYGLVTEDIYGNPVTFDGTSASAPVGTGSIAAGMKNGYLPESNAKDAADLAFNNLNETGAPGTDQVYGGGTFDLGRVIDSNTAGIIDAALASHWVTLNERGQYMLQVTVQNRGTSTFYNAPVQVTTPTGTVRFNVGSLAPGKTTTFSVPIGVGDSPLRFQSMVGIPAGQNESNTANNTRTDVYTPAKSK